MSLKVSSAALHPHATTLNSLFAERKTSNFHDFILRFSIGFSTLMHCQIDSIYSLNCSRQNTKKKVQTATFFMQPVLVELAVVFGSVPCCSFNPTDHDTRRLFGLCSNLNNFFPFKISSCDAFLMISVKINISCRTGFQAGLPRRI